MIKYNLLLYLFAPYLIIKVIANAIKRKNGVSFILQRLGLSKIKKTKNVIWLHASSIGETRLAILIYKSLEKKEGNSKFLITTTTKSSSKLVNEIDGDVEHLYLPIDWYFTTKRFIKSINPSICIIVETEIWPNLLQLCKENNIPSIIVNARLSKKTTDINRFIKSIYRISLSNLTKIMCKSEVEKKKYIELGADPKNVEVIGNLKFIEYSITKNNEDIIKRKYVLAASTHQDEERQIIVEWLKLKERKILLVVVPRHPERLGDILSDLPLSMINISIRSKGEPIKKNTQIYIADTYGELNGLFEHCEFIFMGGSLVDHGGQNFLEAAAYGKTIIVGPYMYNFITETEEFLKNNCMLMVKNSTTLKHLFEKLIKSKQRRELFGSNAKKLLESKKGIIDNYSRNIKSLMS